MKRIFALSYALVFLASCGHGREIPRGQSATPAELSGPCKESVISKETAVLIAKGDAVENYTLSVYDIIAEEKPDGWRIVFKLKDPGVRGGGPDYLIDKKTGKILKATYYK